MYEKEISTVKTASRGGLWTAVGLVLASALFVWLAPWRFQQSEAVAKGMLVAGSLLAVAAVSMALLVIRRRIPALRQADSLEAKLRGYADHVRSLYRSMLAVVAVLCAMTVLSGQSVLLMLSMVATVMLFLAYPNIYKIKADLGLSGSEMRLLFGDQYVGDDAE
ncbi:MAG: hypothetical protein J6I49_06425 [Bacteroidales bacterium]|nr:hypothetical protein [Bacteroidales bacterium]